MKLKVSKKLSNKIKIDKSALTKTETERPAISEAS